MDTSSTGKHGSGFEKAGAVSNLGSGVSTGCTATVATSVQLPCCRWVERRVGGATAWGVIWAAALVLFSSALAALSQGNLTVLQTGGGQPLVSTNQVLQTTGVGSPAIQFDFGFATDESPTSGVFLDSFTVSLEDGASNVAVVATADASGVTWAPYSPGAVPLTDAQILRLAIAPPNQAPVSGQGVGYAVQVPVPSVFTGSSVAVIFDLFDNENSLMSTGWFQNVQVTSVPEPPAGLLFGLGLVITAIKRRFNR